MMRNEYLVFSPQDLAEIGTATDGFVRIANAMGIEPSLEVVLTPDKETAILTLTVGISVRTKRYSKSVVEPWQATLNRIRADLFGTLAYMAAK